MDAIRESVEQQATHVPFQPDDLAALLAWWQACGVDTCVADAPQSWFSAPPPQVRTAAPRIAEQTAMAKSPARPPMIAPDGEFSDVRSLDDLLEKLRAENPLVPIADGNPQSGVMLIGEGPSAEDLRTGRPFTGPAGRLLDRMLAAIGLDRTGCYIGLAAPRRAIPGPVPADSMADDLALTLAHIRLAAPRVLLLLGGPATHILTGDTTVISRQRGKWREVHIDNRAIPALPTYNPAYLLRRPEAKRETWDDLQAFRRRLGS